MGYRKLITSSYSNWGEAPNFFVEISIISALRQPSDPLLMLIQLPIWGGGGGGGGLESFLGGLDFFLGGLALTSGGVQPPLTPPVNPPMIFRINVVLNFDLKFLSGILS